jgi:hypothetical protein
VNVGRDQRFAPLPQEEMLAGLEGFCFSEALATWKGRMGWIVGRGIFKDLVSTFVYWCSPLSSMASLLFYARIKVEELGY